VLQCLEHSWVAVLIHYPPSTYIKIYSICFPAKLTLDATISAMGTGCCGTLSRYRSQCISRPICVQSTACSTVPWALHGVAHHVQSVRDWVPSRRVVPYRDVELHRTAHRYALTTNCTGFLRADRRATREMVRIQLRKSYYKSPANRCSSCTAAPGLRRTPTVSDVHREGRCTLIPMIKNYPFPDGIKPIGHATMEMFLILNGHELKARIDK